MKTILNSLNLIILGIFFHSSVTFAGLEYKQVESIGYGVNENDAIQDALIQALSQVKGTFIKADKIKAVERSIKDNKENIRKESMSKISNFTMGLIINYEIISSNKDADHNYEVRLKSTIPQYDAGPQTKRLRLSILPFRTTSEVQNPESEKFLNTWVRELEEGIVQTRKFAVLDRSYQKEINSELESYLDGHKPEETSRLGQKIGADYIMIGSLISFNPKKADASFPEITKNKISLRIIDVASGQIKYARKVSSPKLAVQQILDAIYPIPVISVQGRKINIGVGGDNLKVGDTYEIFSLGKELYDPYTKESLGFEESSVGSAKIVKVNSKTTIAESDGKTDLSKLFEGGKLILRSSSSGIQHSTTSISPTNETDW